MYVAQRFCEAARLQVAHRVGGYADAGYDDSVGVVERARVVRDVRREAGVLDRARDATQVACAVVDDDDPFCSHGRRIVARTFPSLSYNERHETDGPAAAHPDAAARGAAAACRRSRGGV